MRLWSIHPQYLDAQGLVALWREGLLARKVLSGHTKGYKHHPQLTRFRSCENPIAAIDWYLSLVLDEAKRRNYNFDASKIDVASPIVISVTNGQLEYERKHLLSKLQRRSPILYQRFCKIKTFHPNPAFKVVDGDVEQWENKI